MLQLVEVEFILAASMLSFNFSNMSYSKNRVLWCMALNKYVLCCYVKKNPSEM